MKRNLLTAVCGILLAAFATAQIPQGLNYQAVARNAAGNVLQNTAVSLRLTVHDNTATGTTLYQETQNATTNQFGLFSLYIGGGTIVSGTFSSINWGTNDKYLQVELDPAGGTNYADMGTSQLASVPYALYAGSAANTYWAAGSTNIFNTNSGNVGIGTSAPESLLHLRTDGSLTNGLRISAINNSTPGAAIMLEGANTQWNILATNSGSASGANKFVIRDYGQAADRLVIDNTGNINIGTSGPLVSVFVRGTIGMNDGTAPGADKVMTSDYFGNAHWASPMAAQQDVMYCIALTGTYPSQGTGCSLTNAIYIGEIRAFPFNFAPCGWQKCDGTLLSIAANNTLFSLLGTTYGGDGVNNFAVPDLRGKALKGNQ